MRRFFGIVSVFSLTPRGYVPLPKGTGLPYTDRTAIENDLRLQAHERYCRPAG